MANTTLQQETPFSQVISSDTVSGLNTAVAAAVNTLVKRYVNPGRLGTATTGTPKTVINGSVHVSNAGSVITSNNATTYYQTIIWSEIVDPT